MAVAPTGAIYKALKFDNVSSRTYGVYITGEAVYNAPERDVEMITIPGRNGSFALDNGRFQNIEVSYPAGIFADTEADFRQAVSDFRNFLCSRKGYVRLQDEYNPDEYRMAVYKSGLEVDPAMFKAGEFTITFDCKPQRWLTSGETKVTIANSGDTITNPTLFESSPLLAVYGYGTIGFNGYEIEIDNATLGTISIAGTESIKFTGGTTSTTISFEQGQFNNGDTITVYPITFRNENVYDTQYRGLINVATVTDSYSGATTTYETYQGMYGTNLRIYTEWPTVAFSVGTANQFENNATFTGTYGNGTSFAHQKLRTRIAYDGAGTITISNVWTASGEQLYISTLANYLYADITNIEGLSTVSLLGNPNYVDCDLGEVYRIVNGSFISLNAYVDLGSKLPTLASGSNTITYDNTVTQLDVIPRWWKV